MRIRVFRSIWPRRMLVEEHESVWNQSHCRVLQAVNDIPSGHDFTSVCPRSSSAYGRIVHDVDGKECLDEEHLVKRPSLKEKASIDSTV